MTLECCLEGGSGSDKEVIRELARLTCDPLLLLRASPISLNVTIQLIQWWLKHLADPLFPRNTMSILCKIHGQFSMFYKGFKLTPPIDPILDTMSFSDPPISLTLLDPTSENELPSDSAERCGIKHGSWFVYAFTKCHSYFGFI